MKKYLIPVCTLFILASCQNPSLEPDGYGHFEADEFFISSEIGGKILYMFSVEGAPIDKGDTLAIIDTSGLVLKIQAYDAQEIALRSKIPVLDAQRKVLQSEIKGLSVEFERMKRLKESGAATIQQFEKLESQLATAQVRLSTFPSQIESIRLEINALQIQALQVRDQVNRAFVTASAEGVVLEKYQNSGELAVPGKPLFKVAPLKDLYLRAYVSGMQLSSFKIGQELVVRIDSMGGGYQEFTGTITWVADEAEFTPKMIQTKEERVNLVYAIKVRVKNPGELKIGMPGEIVLK